MNKAFACASAITLLVLQGVSVAVAPLTTAVLSSVDAAHTGAASGFNSAVARTGGLIATALLGSALGARGEALSAGFDAAALAAAGAAALAALAALLLLRPSEIRTEGAPDPSP